MELTTQSPVNTTQLQTHRKPNKWVINLSSTPLSHTQDFLLSKGANYAITHKNSPI